MQKWLLLLVMLLPGVAGCAGAAAGLPEATAEPTQPAVVFATATATDAPAPTAAAVTAATLPAADTPAPPPSPTASDTPTAVPTESPTPELDWLATTSRTDDGMMALGNPAAAVTLIDYSDFM